jgi:hypothetical protein
VKTWTIGGLLRLPYCKQRYNCSRSYGMTTYTFGAFVDLTTKGVEAYDAIVRELVRVPVREALATYS